MTASKRRRPRVAGHRGASASFPENTLVAFNAAIEAGADAIEFDVHSTADGELVVVHDYTLGRTTNADGLIHELTWSEIRSLDAGGWFDQRYVGERIPRVHQILSLPVRAFELEVKGLASKALVESLSRAVEASGRSEDIEITGHNHVLVREIKRRLLGVQSGYFVPKREPWMPERLYHQLVERSASFGGFDVVHARLADLRALDVEALHALGLLVHAAEVTGTEQLAEATDLGADHLTTDDPGAALAYFLQTGPPRHG